MCTSSGSSLASFMLTDPFLPSLDYMLDCVYKHVIRMSVMIHDFHRRIIIQHEVWFILCNYMCCLFVVKDDKSDFKGRGLAPFSLELQFPSR